MALLTGAPARAQLGTYPPSEAYARAQDASFPRYPRNAPGVRDFPSPLLRRMVIVLMVPVAKAI